MGKGHLLAVLLILQVISTDGCESDWTLLDNKCYNISYDRYTWTGARCYCQGRNSDLAVIETSTKYTLMKQILPSYDFPFGGGQWLGAQDTETEDDWKWIGNIDVTYSDWIFFTSEPNGGTNENCLIVSKSSISTASWFDGDCNVQYNALCEKDLLGATLPATDLVNCDITTEMSEATTSVTTTETPSHPLTSISVQPTIGLLLSPSPKGTLATTTLQSTLTGSTTASTSATEQNGPTCRGSHFHLAANGSKCLKNHVLQDFVRWSPISCAATCIREQPCLSFNFYVASKRCEINSKDSQLVSVENMVDEVGCKLYDLKV
ncbi:uncharacterized protein [Amphiura filiformis]|uniref:uncharacterized protein n=1 Tax=Amphiura filiformis TaxID=82378 RepID=UPI003B21310E